MGEGKMTESTKRDEWGIWVSEGDVGEWVDLCGAPFAAARVTAEEAAAALRRTDPFHDYVVRRI